MKKLKTHLAVITAFVLVITMAGCSSGSAANKFNEATSKLKASESHTMKMTLSIKTDYENDTGDSKYADSNVVRSLETKYQKPSTPGANSLEGSKMSVFTYTSTDGDIDRFYFYIKDDVLYLQMIDESEDYLYVDLDSPDYQNASTPASSLTALDFLISGVTKDDLDTERESILFRSETLNAKVYNVTPTDNNFVELAHLFAVSLNTVIDNEADFINSLDFKSIEYKLFVDDKNNVIRIEIRYTVTMPSPAGDSTMVKADVYLQSDIYDVNKTTVEYPDLSNAISYSDMN